MKVLQINAVYGIGSTGNIVADISSKLVEQGIESYVFWAIEAKKTNDDKTVLIRVGDIFDHKMHALLYRIFGGQAMFSRISTRQACKKILKISPDVVHLHNLHSNFIHLPMLLKFLAKHNISTVITLHDCWFLTGQCVHYINYNCNGWNGDCSNCPAAIPWHRKGVTKRFLERKKIFSSMKHLAVCGVSKWTADAAKKSILGTAHTNDYIYNWIDTSTYKPYYDVEYIREKYKISKDKKIILGVSHCWSDNKGLKNFVSLADELSCSAEIVLVGQHKKNELAHENIKFIGYTENSTELAKLYSLADVLVNASPAETFGLVTVEALACGTPVVAYNNTGSSEIVVKECGMLAEDGDFSQLLSCVKEVLKRGKSFYSENCRKYAVEHFNKSTQIQEYINLYKNRF